MIEGEGWRLTMIRMRGREKSDCVQRKMKCEGRGYMVRNSPLKG